MSAVESVEVTAETVTDEQIRAERVMALRARNFAFVTQCDSALRRSDDLWLREPIAAAINARAKGGR